MKQTYMQTADIQGLKISRYNDGNYLANAISSRLSGDAHRLLHIDKLSVEMHVFGFFYLSLST